MEIVLTSRRVSPKCYKAPFNPVLMPIFRRERRIQTTPSTGPVNGSGQNKRRPRIFYGWYIVGASILLNSYFSISFWQGFTVFFLPILNDFNVSRTVLSGAFSLRQVESGFLSPIIGYLVDRVGPRKVILVGVIIVGTGMVLISLAANIWLFYAAFIYASIGMSGASHGITWAVVVARWFRRKRGRATSLAMMGGALGGPSVILISILEGAVGWRTAVFWLGLGVLVVGIPLSLVARARPQDYGYLPDGDVPPETPGKRAAVPVRTAASPPQPSEFTVKQALRSRVFWALAGVLGAQQASMGGLQVHQIAYFQGIGFSGTQAAATVAVAFSVSAIGRISAGVLMDIFDWRRVLAIIMFGQLISLLILANVTVYWQALVFAVILGLFHGMSVPSRPIIAGTIFGTRAFGTIWGVVDGAIVTVGLAGPIFLGWTFDTFGTYVPAFYVMMAVLAVTIPFVFLAFRTTKPAQNPGNG